MIEARTQKPAQARFVPTAYRPWWHSVTFALMLLALGLLYYWSYLGIEVPWSRLPSAGRRMLDFVSRSWPPDFAWGFEGTNLGNILKLKFPIAGPVWDAMLVTLQSAIMGTTLAAVFAMPISFFAARNLSHPVVYAFTRVLLNIDRGIDTLIVALFFVSAVGLGVFPGVLAIAVHSIGVLAKMYSEAIEDINTGQVEALQATGADRWNVIRWAILPQVVPHFIAYTLYRFELNVRVAVVLGLVGGGGIGLLLQSYQRLFDYPKVAVLVAAIVVVVIAIDYLSAKLRQMVI